MSAFQYMRSGDMAGIVEAKVMRTLLLAQPGLGSKLLEASSLAQRVDLLLAGLRSTGLIGLANTQYAQTLKTPKPGRNRFQRSRDSRPPLEVNVAVDVRPEKPEPPVQPNPPEQPSRWSRARHAKTTDSKQGWQTVSRHKPPLDEGELVDEWSVPVASSLHFHKPGICFVTGNEAAQRCKDTVAGSFHAQAVVTRKKLENFAEEEPEKIAFHIRKEVQRGASKTMQQTAVVGWLYNLTPRKVTLRTPVQSTSISVSASTIVVKVSTHQQFCPPDTWSALTRGKLKVLQTALISVLQEHDPKHVQCVQDIFMLQQSGKLMTALIRVTAGSLHALMSASGKSFVFVQPMPQQADDYPVVWDCPLPTTLDAVRQRAEDLGALSLALGEKRIGFRVTAAMELTVRAALEKPRQATWRISGVPMSCSYTDVVEMLDDFALEGTVVETSRRLFRRSQSWLVRCAEDAQPVEDTIQVVGDDDRFYFVTLTLMQGRQSGSKVKQWHSKPRARGQSQPPAPADSPPPPSPSPGAPRAASVPSRATQFCRPVAKSQPSAPSTRPSKVIQLEHVVQILVRTLANSGGIPQELQEVVDTCLGPAPTLEDSEGDEGDNDDTDGENGADHDECLDQDGMDVQDGDAGPDFSDLPKRGRQHDSQEDESARKGSRVARCMVAWSYTAPFDSSRYAFRRVRGDGNCFWRCLSVLLKRPWYAIKKDALAKLPELQTAWLSCFPSVTVGIWQTLVAGLETDGAYANEVAIGAACVLVGRPIIIIAADQTWTVSDRTLETTRWDTALVLRHTGESSSQHFDPIQGDVPQALLEHIRAQMACTSVAFSGGGGEASGNSSTFSSFNCSAIA
eukprot:2130002-Amphidinium_carterae.2